MLNHPGRNRRCRRRLRISRAVDKHGWSRLIIGEMIASSSFRSVAQRRAGNLFADKNSCNPRRPGLPGSGMTVLARHLKRIKRSPSGEAGTGSPQKIPLLK